MPPLTAELAGVAAVVALLLVIALVVDPRLRARRAANKLARIRRHAAAGCVLCRQELVYLDHAARLEALRAKVDSIDEALKGGLR